MGDHIVLGEPDLVTHQYHLRVVEALVAERNHYRSALERVEAHGSGYAVKVARAALLGSAFPRKDILMAYKPVDDARAVKAHDEALANHARAWDEMHDIGIELGRDAPEYQDTRRMVVLLREDITRARMRVDTKRHWKRT